MKPLVIIPARGGSKGVPGKNIKLLNDKPLIHYTIDAARLNFSDDLICVSTDDEDIRRCVEDIGLKVPFLRPSALSQDNSGTYDVLLHALSYYKSIGYEADVVVLLQPTSPFRNAIHIQNALKLYTSELDMVVSVKETSSNPYYVLFEEDDNGYLIKSKDEVFVTRQECPKVWEYNGAIYIINVNSLMKGKLNSFRKIKKFVMSDVASIDIDSPLDWDLAEVVSNKSINQ